LAFTCTFNRNVDLTTEEKLILLTLEQTRLADVTELAAQAGLPVSKVKHLVRKLKLKGLIQESSLEDDD
jgi:DNA-binding MarR family transcriptional regulator